MIVLNFANVETALELGEDTKKWTDEIYFSGFFGNQIFKIDGADFSADLPVLGFARELKAICFRFKHGSIHEEYVDPEYECPFVLKFQRDAHTISVCSVGKSDKKLFSSATVSIDELSFAASEYFDRVVSHCSKFNPEIKTNPIVWNWLNDLSLPGYQCTL